MTINSPGAAWGAGGGQVPLGGHRRRPQYPKGLGALGDRLSSYRKPLRRTLGEWVSYLDRRWQFSADLLTLRDSTVAGRSQPYWVLGLR